MFKRLRRKIAVRQGSIVLLDQGTLSIANFVTGALVARSSSTEDYGIYVLAWSILLIIHGIHKGIASLPYTVYSPRLDNHERASYFGSTLIHTLLVCALVAAIMLSTYLFKDDTSPTDRVSIYGILPILTVLITALLFREFSRSVLLAQLRVTECLIPNLIATTAQLAAAGALYLNNWLTLTNIFIVLTATNAMAAVALLHAQHHDWVVNRSKLWSDFIRSSRIGRWQLASGLTYTAGYQLYPWLILPLLGKHDVAAYGVCLALANLPAPFLRGACAYILPRMAHGYKDGNLDTLMQLLRKSMLVFIIPYGLWLIIGTAFGEDLTTFIYSEKYSGYTALLFWLLLRTTIESVATPLTTALQAMEKIHVITISGLLGAVITLALGPLAISHMGVIGAGVISAVVALTMTTYRWLAIRRYIDEYKG